jgi:hypothetical protein
MPGRKLAKGAIPAKYAALEDANTKTGFPQLVNFRSRTEQAHLGSWGKVIKKTELEPAWKVVFVLLPRNLSIG